MRKSLFTTREIADLIGSDAWRVRRVFESGDLPEPDRLAGKRIIPGTLIPAICEALHARGWLRDGEELPVAPAIDRAVSSRAVPATLSGPAHSAGPGGGSPSG